MNFSEPLQTVALGLPLYLVVRIINYMIIFCHIFNLHQAFFMALRRASLKFSENYKEKQRDIFFNGLHFVMP